MTTGIILSENAWMFMYALGFVPVILALVYAHFKKKSEQMTAIWLLGGLVITLVIWMIPIQLSKEEYTVPEGIFAAILYALDALTLQSFEYEIGNAPENPGILFSLSIMIVRLIMIGLSFTAVLLFFRVPAQYITDFGRKRRKKAYVFVGCNERNRLIAKSISMSDKKSARSRERIIFLLEDMPTEEEGREIKEAGGVFFVEEPDTFFRFILKSRQAKDGQEIYIFGKEDAQNLERLDSVYQILSNEKKNTSERNVRIYIELNDSSWDVQNHLEKRFLTEGDPSTSPIIIQYIRSAENYASNNLIRNSIFLKREKDEVKDLRILLVGMDSYSKEMLKTLLWLGQMPGYRLNIHVIEEGHEIRKLFFECPGLRECVQEDGYAIYTIKISEGVEYRTQEFMERVDESLAFDFAFINTGDDRTNYSVASRIGMARRRKGITPAATIQLKNRDHLLEGMEIAHVVEVGSEAEIYSRDNICNSEIENVARLIHDLRQEEKRKAWEKKQKAESPDKIKPYKKVAWEEYCRDEYMRKSVYSRALSLKYKILQIHEYENDRYENLNDMSTEWIKYEHMRWNVYEWTIGYVYAPKRNNEIKVHNLLIPYDQLSVEEQKKDGITVDKEIIEYFLQKG